tara:strand:- start:144 stop:926 length:783 start_codon:yes stop_codon:yes gene_type:complete
MESFGWEGEESLYTFCFICSIVTIILYHNFLKMEFPEESPDWLFYFIGWAQLIFLGEIVISEIIKNIMEIYGSSPTNSFYDFNDLSEEAWYGLVSSQLLVVSIFIYYLRKLAPDRALNQRKEKKESEEKAEEKKRLQREAEAQRLTQNRALWSRKRKRVRAIAESVFPEIISFKYNPYIDELEIKTNEQELCYYELLEENLEEIRKEFQYDYEDREVSRTSNVSNYSRSRRYGYSTDDDINSVDGGPPSEAYDDASDDDG